MSDKFDAPMEHMIDVWLLVMSTNNDIRKILTANDLKKNPNFKQLDKEHVYSMTMNVANTPTKLRNHYAKKVNKTVKYICFLDASGGDALVKNPIWWDVNDFKK